MRANIETDGRAMTAFSKRSMLFGLMMTPIATPRLDVRLFAAPNSTLDNLTR